MSPGPALAQVIGSWSRGDCPVVALAADPATPVAPRPVSPSGFTDFSDADGYALNGARFVGQKDGGYYLYAFPGSFYGRPETVNLLGLHGGADDGQIRINVPEGTSTVSFLFREYFGDVKPFRVTFSNGEVVDLRSSPDDFQVFRHTTATPFTYLTVSTPDSGGYPVVTDFVLHPAAADNAGRAADSTVGGNPVPFTALAPFGGQPGASSPGIGGGGPGGGSGATGVPGLGLGGSGGIPGGVGGPLGGTVLAPFPNVLPGAAGPEDRLLGGGLVDDGTSQAFGLTEDLLLSLPTISDLSGGTDQTTDVGQGTATVAPSPTPLPGPASLSLLGTGLCGLLGYAWRRRPAGPSRP
jgi:hypothetical protein